MQTAVSAQIEKFWCLETLKPYLANWNFRMKNKAPFKIKGGGADGLKANMYLFEYNKP